MAQLAIRLLGSLHVTRDGRPVTAFESDKVRALLAYLAVESDQAHRREKLAGLLWPMLPERSARTNLRVALSNLRKVVEDSSTFPLLSVDRQTIQLDPEADVWIDVQAFSHLLAAEGRPRNVVASLRQAVELYRGGFLEGFSLPDSAEFEEWALLQRERFQRQVVAALRRLSRWHERRGEYRQALPSAQRLVTLEPWQEVDHRWLMRLLALTGQRNAALAQYRALQRTLSEELRVEPEDGTTAQYERIRKGQALREGTSPPGRTNLPIPTTPFVGREPELAEIYRRLQDPGCRLLAVVGPGGSGKTRLALEAAADCLSGLVLPTGQPAFRPADGVFFVPLAPLRSAEAIVSATAQALGFSFRRDGTPRQQLLDYLRHKAMLLVMDNFEHLLDSVGFVSAILTAAPQVKILATSRARLNMLAEHLFPTGGMALPEAVAPGAAPSTEKLMRYDGVDLFVSSARRVHPEFCLTSGNAFDVVRICRLVDGLPLAILLAAAWVDTIPPAELAAQLSDATAQSLDLLGSEWQDVPERQRSLRAAFEHSWNLLTARQQEVLQALAVFRGGFTRRAAREVTGAQERELGALVHKSLLSDAREGRYEMHEMLRQYLAGKLDRSPGTRETVHERHSAYYTTLLARWGANLKGQRQQAALAEMRSDGENARAAWDWAVQRTQVERLFQAMDGLCLFYQRRGRYLEGEAACHIAASRLAEDAAPGTGGDSHVEGPGSGGSGDKLCALTRILVWRGAFLEVMGRHEEARQCVKRGLALLTNPVLCGQNVQAEKALGLLQMGHVELNFDPSTARQLYGQSLTIYQGLADPWGAANALYALSDAAWFQGAYADARDLCEESLALRRETGDLPGIAECLVALSNTLPRQGELEAGVRLGEEGIAILRDLDDAGGTAMALGELGTALAFSGEFARSVGMYQEALSVRTELGMFSELPMTTMALGHVEMHLGRYEQAQARGRSALALAQESGQHRAAGNSWFLLGSLEVVREEYAEAYKTLREGVEVTREGGQQAELGRILATLGYAARGLGNVREARELFSQALRLGADLWAWFPLHWSLAGLALLLADEGRFDQGKAEPAVELYSLATAWPAVANSRWFEDVVGQQIARAAATLPPEVAARARERGQTGDLETTVAALLVELDD
jgi:DNA-binding SARP family transcriptional activator/predicted ATPase